MSAGHYPLLVRLLAAGADPAACPDVLVHAIRRDRVDMVRLLVDAGCDVNVGVGVAPMFAAVMAPSSPALYVALLLAEPTVDLTVTDGRYGSLQCTAARGRHDDIAAMVESEVGVAVQAVCFGGRHRARAIPVP